MTKINFSSFVCGDRKRWKKGEVGGVFNVKFYLGRKKTKARMVTVSVESETSSCSYCHVALEVMKFGWLLRANW